MKIRVDFTVDVADIPALKELAVSDDLEGVREFVRAEASDALLEYLKDNGVRAKRVRGPGSWDH